MKIKLLGLLLMVLLFTMVNAPVGAAQCGTVDEVVMARVDNMGVAPRLGAGSQAVFDCVAAIDPNFNQVRFQSSWEALNYWFILQNQGDGLQRQPLSAPTN